MLNILSVLQWRGGSDKDTSTGREKNSKQRNAAIKRRKRELIYPIAFSFKKRILKTVNLMFKVSFNP
jgi:hypothetical protein